MIFIFWEILHNIELQKYNAGKDKKNILVEDHYSSTNLLQLCYPEIFINGR